MTDFNSEEIEALTLREIAGTLPPGDKKRLLQYIADNEEARLLRQQLHDRFTPELLSEIRSMLPSKEQFIHTIMKRQHQRYMRGAVTLLLFAGVLVTVLLRHFYPVRPLSATQAVDTTSVSPPDRIQLQRKNGKEINIPINRSPLWVTSVPFVNENAMVLRPARYRRTAQVCNNLELPRKVIGRGKSFPTSIAGQYTLRVPANMDYIVILSDSTEVHLNANSTITFPAQFTGSKRKINITGEAYLKVAPRAQQPFVVTLAEDCEI